MSALSDSTTTTASPLVTLSPGFLSQDTTCFFLVDEREREREKREKSREREKERESKSENKKRRGRGRAFFRLKRSSGRQRSPRAARKETAIKKEESIETLLRPRAACYSSRPPFPLDLSSQSRSISCARKASKCGSPSRRKRGQTESVFPLRLATGPKRAREKASRERASNADKDAISSRPLSPSSPPSLVKSILAANSIAALLTLPSVIVDESAGMMTSLTALALTLPRRALATVVVGRGATALEALAPGRDATAAAGPEAVARATAECMIASSRGKGGSARALEGRDAGGEGKGEKGEGILILRESNLFFFFSSFQSSPFFPTSTSSTSRSFLPLASSSPLSLTCCAQPERQRGRETRDTAQFGFLSLSLSFSKKGGGKCFVVFRFQVFLSFFFFV